MRATLNHILIALSIATLTDDEFSKADPFLDAGMNVDTYKYLLSVLDSRELVSNDRDRLTALFIAKGVDGVTSAETSPARTNIFVGATL